jgi:hypothetical protein
MDLPPKRPSSHPPFNIDSLEASCTNQRIVQLKAQQLCSVNLSLSSIISIINIKRTKGKQTITSDKHNTRSKIISLLRIIHTYKYPIPSMSHLSLSLPKSPHIHPASQRSNSPSRITAPYIKVREAISIHPILSYILFCLGKMTRDPNAEI